MNIVTDNVTDFKFDIGQVVKHKTYKSYSGQQFLIIARLLIEELDGSGNRVIHKGYRVRAETTHPIDMGEFELIPVDEKDK